MVSPPLEIFKDFCEEAGWSLDDVSQLAAQRHFGLISSEDVPTSDGNPAHKNKWQAETAIGVVGIIVVAGDNKAHGYTQTCSVTAPTGSASMIQSWLSSSFGAPTATRSKPQNATEVHWAQTFKDGKIEVTLVTKTPDQKSAASNRELAAIIARR